MLPLPLARMAADEHERRRRAEPRDRTRMGADQERQTLDRRVATDVEEDRAARLGPALGSTRAGRWKRLRVRLAARPTTA
jgi:hypothetical protein